jgi:uncharacterized protein YrrD
VSVLLRAAELVKRPVVTLTGHDIAQIKDVIYASSTGTLAGFTLNGRGMFSGPLRKTLPWTNVHGLGPDAVMIKDDSMLAGKDALSGQREGAGGGVLGSRVLTDGGRELGRVTDLILAVGEGATDAVGYEIEPTDDAAPRRQFVPLPDTLAVSGEALVVPDAATEFIRDDLAGFGAAVDEFRERLRAGAPPGSTVTAGPPPSAGPSAVPSPSSSTGEPVRDREPELTHPVSPAETSAAQGTEPADPPAHYRVAPPAEARPGEEEGR